MARRKIKVVAKRLATKVVNGQLTLFDTALDLEGVEGLDFLWGHYDDTSPEGQALLVANALRDTPDPTSVAGGILFDFMRQVSHKFPFHPTGDH